MILVDCQYGFCEGGKLPVEGAMKKMEELSTYLTDRGNGYFEKILFTVDFHPITHCSFMENGGEWPMHCVQFTHDAAIVEEVFEAANDVSITEVFTKGNASKMEEFSVFQNYVNGPQVRREISNADVIEITGIMSEVCLLNTIKDLVRMGFGDKLFVHTQFSPTMDKHKALTEFLIENNVKFDN